MLFHLIALKLEAISFPEKSILAKKNKLISFEVQNICGGIESEPFLYLTSEVRTNRAYGKALGKHDLGLNSMTCQCLGPLSLVQNVDT